MNDRSTARRSRTTGRRAAVAALALAAGFASLVNVASDAQASGGSGGGGSIGGSTGGSSGGGSGGGGGTKAPCDPFSGATAIADLSGIKASYTLALCLSGKTTVNVQFKNASGAVVSAVTDPVGNQAVLTNIVFASNYSVVFTATSSRTGGIVGTTTVAVTTPTLGVNCATGTTVEPRMGYYSIYPAVWISYATLNCGYGMQTAEIRITNLDTGVLMADYTNMPTAMNLDYEGAIVAYDTNYQFEVIIHGAMGEVLDSATSVGHTVPRL